MVVIEFAGGDVEGVSSYLHERLSCHGYWHAVDERLYLVALLAHLMNVVVPVAC